MPEETTRTVRLNEATIDRLSEENPTFGFNMRPCDLEGDDLGVHVWLVVQTTYGSDGEPVRQEVIDCDRKDC
jgi:hypothetical protein